MEDIFSLKGEDFEINGTHATVTLRSPFSITRPGMPGKNKALEKKQTQEPPEQEPENNARGDDTVVRKEFRFISEVIIQDCWCPFDLTKNNVLKAALPLFKGLGLFKDHYKHVDNNIGGVQDCYYDDSSTPKGINGFVCVDREIDPLTAIRVEKGWINRCSITLCFDWVQSHDMKSRAFFDSLGDVIDGEMVRLIVTKITSITEVSLVFFGADPNAKALSLNAVQNEKFNTKEVNQVDEELKKLLEAVLKKDIKTEVQYNQAVKTILEDLELLRGENLSLEKQVEALQKAKEFQDTVIEGLRKEVLIDAKKVGMGNVKVSHQMLINQADYNALLELKKEFNADLEKMFPLKCANCGAPNVERRSSVELTPPQPKETEKPDLETSMADLHQ